MIWTPHKYQQAAVDFLVEREYGALLLDPGLGKTGISLEVIRSLKSQYGYKALVQGPLRVIHSTWPREIEKWENFSGLKFGILHGKNKDEVLHDESVDIFLMNYEGLPWLVNHIDATRKKDMPFQVLFNDESSKLKRTKTERYRIMKHIYKKFDRRYNLTGSPAANGLMGLFPQALIMDGGESLGKYITHFRDRFFYRAGYKGFQWKLKPGADQEIYQLIAPRMLRMSARDYLELPPLVKRVVNVSLPDMAMKAHREMKKKLITEISSGKVKAGNAGLASMKCRQIANGGLITGEHSWEHLHMEKAQATFDLVEELEGQPALIAFEFQHDLDRLLKVFGKDTPVIDGSTPLKRFKVIESEWNKGNIPVLLAHPSPVAYGLNMQDSGRAVIWHSLTPNLEWHDQFIARIWRQGQKNRVFVYYMIAEGTVDEVVYKSLRIKSREQGDLFSALKRYWAEDDEMWYN